MKKKMKWFPLKRLSELNRLVSRRQGVRVVVGKGAAIMAMELQIQMVQGQI